MIIFLCSPQARARQLFKAGYKSLNSLAWADVNSLMTDIEHLSRRQANQIVSAAKVKLVELDGSLVAVRGVGVLSVHTYSHFTYCFSEKFTSFAHPQIAIANLKWDMLTELITREKEEKTNTKRHGTGFFWHNFRRIYIRLRLIKVCLIFLSNKCVPVVR